MVEHEVSASVRQYGPFGFVATLANILFVEFVTWLLLPWFYLAVFLIPVLLLDLGLSALLVTRHGRVREIGRGLMIGCISGPATLVVFIPLYFLVQAAGLI
jgi:hypothetical protein